MRLYEFEGKKLLARYCVPVPHGVLWPSPISYPAVAKAQLLEGGRGKRGGIRIVGDNAQAEKAATELLRGSDELSPAHSVLLEEYIAPQRELYLALLMDRDARAPVLLASPAGGVEIESSRDVRREILNPLTGVTNDIVERVAAELRVSPADIQPILAAAWRLFIIEDSLLVEINPLAVTPRGLIALDVRVVLDDNARCRHPEWPAPREGTAFEQRCAQLGASGTEFDGNIAIVSSGAGLGMATLDLIVALGGRPRCLVDLGGTVFAGPQPVEAVVEAAITLLPSVYLFNFFFQLARCDILAQGIAAAFERHPLHYPVILRMKGNNVQEAKEILAPYGFQITDDLGTACRRAIEAVDGYTR